jgi:hypothetical protein
LTETLLVLKPKNKERKEYREKLSMRVQSTHYPQVPVKKKGLSLTKKIFMGLMVIAIVVALGSYVLQPQGGAVSGYPINVSPTVYSAPSISTDNSKATVPFSNVNSSKLVFVDIKLTNPVQTLQYQDRTIPLIYYRNGQYLPIVIISTPEGRTVAGIRTCEPCGSFSFHIVKGANLKCDVCGAEWSLEDFSPVSGGCAAYPPPKLTTTLYGDNIVIDLSPLNLQYAP